MNKRMNEEKELIDKILKNDMSAYDKLQNIKFNQCLKILERYDKEIGLKRDIVSRIENEFQTCLREVFFNLNSYEDKEKIIFQVNNSISRFCKQKAIKLKLSESDETKNKISLYTYELLSFLLKKYRVDTKQMESSVQPQKVILFDADEVPIEWSNIGKYLTELKNKNIIGLFQISENGKCCVEFSDTIIAELEHEKYKTLINPNGITYDEILKLQDDFKNNFILEEEIPEEERKMLIWLYKNQNKALRLRLQQKRKENFDIFYKLISGILVNDFEVDKLNIKADASFSEDLGLNRQSFLNLVETITKEVSCSVDIENINENITISDLIKVFLHVNDD